MYFSRFETIFRMILTLLSFGILSIFAAVMFLDHLHAKGLLRAELVSPLPKTTVYAFTETELYFEADQTSVYVDEALSEFIPQKNHSEARMILHCLLHRESGHGASGRESDPHGDGGLAGGPMQFHESTWKRMRSQMISEGAASEVGSRYDLKESVRTTTWAIQKGRAKEWGPILRGSKGSTFAACQEPSWI